MLGWMLWITIWIGATPESTWRVLMESRIARDSGRLNASFWEQGEQTPLATQEFLMTLGQNGNPAHQERIHRFFADPALQASALFAYGEVDGAPIEPLLSVKDSVKAANLGIYAEALSKLARPESHGTLVELWQRWPEKVKSQALFFFWRNKPEDLTRLVLAKLTDRPAQSDSGYVYYLFRAKIKANPNTLANWLGFFEDPQTLMYLTRVEPNEPSPELARAAAALCGAADWRVRVNALRALSGFSPELAEAQGVRLLNDANPNVVKTAAQALARLNTPSADKVLEKGFQRLSPSQQQAVMAAASPELWSRLWPQVESWSQSNAIWKQRQSVGFLAKVDDDRAESELLRLFDAGGPQATLAFDALRQRNYGEMDRLLPRAFESGNVQLMASALDAWSGLENRERTFTTDAVKKLVDLVYVDVDFHYAYLRLLPRIVGEENVAGVLTRLRRHPDYLTRLGALNATSDPTPEMRSAIFEKGWPHQLDDAITAAAARLASGRASWRWRLETTKGSVTVALAGAYAPITAANIAALSDRDYYDGMPFHRVIPNFVVQGGDNRGDGSGGPGYSIPCEINPLRHRRGAVGMALSGKDTGGGQFFICHSDQPHLDGGYTVFGQVVSGMNVVDRLEEGDLILDTAITGRTERP